MISFWSHVAKLLVRRPRPALRAAFWYLTRRKVRARNILRDGTRGLGLAYSVWRKIHEGKEGASATSRTGEAPTCFTVIIHGPDLSTRAQNKWQRSTRSVARQAHSSEVLQTVSGSNLMELIGQAEGDFIFFLRAGDELADSALARMQQALGRTPAVMAYGDEDHLRRGKRDREPWFKPAWNSELFLALDYLSAAVAISRHLAWEVAAELRYSSLCTLDALLLRATERAAGSILHVPSILVHVGKQEEPPGARLAAVAGFLDGRAICLSGPFGTVRVQWPLPDPRPLISIIIPTRDKVELLTACVDGLLMRTDYRPFEILIVDNGSRDRDALEYLEGLSAQSDVRILHCDAEYNFSALNNLAVREANGSFVLLLNNDTEVIEPEWLDEMMRYASRDDVGAVGAKLLYSDGSVQHAGVVVGMGEAAGHAHRYLAAGEPGYFRQPQAAQFVTAVTAACLLVDRRKYEAVGGLDAQNFAIAYNDVDFCLKLERAGWRNVYTPHAGLYHHESKSRGSDFSPQHRERYMRELAVLQERWGTKTFVDPLHSVHLDRYSEAYIPDFR